MAYTPYERLNTFDQGVLDELDKRRKSKNLVQTRTPFLRFTTAVDFGNSKDTSDASFASSMQWLGPEYDRPYVSTAGYFDKYNGCKFFTLGLHGWDNTNYSASDIYNAQSFDGLVVGTTYSTNPSTGKGQQILVKTPPDADVSPRAYPPPGIESATIERNKSGNVLKFTINTVCYTKIQLDMLDILAFSPGMDCVLEWGSLISTKDEIQEFKAGAFLDFTDIENTISILKDWKNNNSRKDFIDKWCAPNNYNYDFGIAKISNIKTTYEDNKYKVTIIAYGKADSILHLSAYATTTEKEKAQQQQELQSTSLHNYFSENSDFILELQSIVSNQKDVNYPYVVYFDEPADTESSKDKPSAAQNVGAVNDLGQEKTYYVRFDRFINYFLNVRIMDIINRGASDKLQKVVADIPDPTAQEGTSVGYNKHLLSTDPSVLIIHNYNARDDYKDIQQLALDKLDTDISKGSGNARDTTLKATSGGISKLLKDLITPYDTDSNKESGSMIPANGIWLNSKGIQQIFLGARTIAEAMETLLNKMNAATEGYWDLKLMHDDSNQDSQFRIVDDNHMQVPKTQQPMYTFNKKLKLVEDGNTVGPEILSININMDYPKLIFSQLAIAGINNASSTADTKNNDGQKNTARDKNGRPLFTNKLKNLLIDEKQSSTPNQNPQTNPVSEQGAGTIGIAAAIDKNARLNGTNTWGAIKEVFGIRTEGYLGSSLSTLNDAFGGKGQLPPQVFSVLKNAASKTAPITESEAVSYVTQLKSITPPLNSSQIDAVKTFFKARAKALITSYKTQEINNFEKFIDGKGPPFKEGGSGYGAAKTGEFQKTAQSKKVIDNINASKDDLTGRFN